MTGLSHKSLLPDPQTALPGRAESMPVNNQHFVHGRPLVGPFERADGREYAQVVLGLGCFWGAERKFWQTAGVYTTAVGYSAGYTPNPTYQEVCTGQTGHNEVVLVVYDQDVINLCALLAVFFESHDPTQGMRQGNDIGTQYRSGIYCIGAEDLAVAERVRAKYASTVAEHGHGTVTTEIAALGEFYYAEEYHQQYLAKNPAGYCGIGGLGISCPG